MKKENFKDFIKVIDVVGKISALLEEETGCICETMVVWYKSNTQVVYDIFEGSIRLVDWDLTTKEYYLMHGIAKISNLEVYDCYTPTPKKKVTKKKATKKKTTKKKGAK
jgi:hypothetical protein